MIRQLLDDFRRLFSAHVTPAHARHCLRQLLRVPMVHTLLSVDPSGEWSPVQARHVLNIIQAEAARAGQYFVAHDVTTFSMRHTRVILVAHCIEHDIAVLPGELCKLCARQ